MASNSDRALLILDLDETLIHASTASLAHEPDFRVGDFYVYRRPFLSNFLARCDENYRLAVWSSASAGYVEAIVDHIVPKDINLAFVWSRDRCTQRLDPEIQEQFYLKNLEKVARLGFSLDRVLIVEDEPRKVQGHYGNSVYVRPFFGAEADDDLDVLANYLPAIASVPNVRRVEKRNWRSQGGE